LHDARLSKNVVDTLSHSSSSALLRRLDDALATGDMAAAVSAGDQLGIEHASQQSLENALATLHGVTPPSFFRNPRAVAPGGQSIGPDDYAGGYHGVAQLDVRKLLTKGLEVRGSNTEIENHVLAGGGSAFRGTTPYVVSPDGSSGAALWAREGGWVIQIADVPTWDANRHLEHQLNRSGLNLSNPVRGEVERLVPGYIPPQHIVRYGKVVEQEGTKRLYVKEWHNNPHFRPTSR